MENEILARFRLGGRSSQGPLQLLEPRLDALPAPLDQAIGVHEDQAAWLDLDRGCRARSLADPDRQRALDGELGDLAVRPPDEGWWMSGPDTFGFALPQV